MDHTLLSGFGLDLDFLSRLLSIVIIDLILAGDNAVIIAMAVRSLPREQRRNGILLGSAAAVLLRVLVTFFVSQILQISFLKLVGGALILGIAVKLFVSGAPEDSSQKQATTIGQAIRIIVIADITMSVDNMLAVGGASGGSLFLLLFGLGLSIPLIIFTSNLLSTLMDKYPIIIYIGAAVLGKVGAEMILTDPAIVPLISLNNYAQYAVEFVTAVLVIVVGKLWIRLMIKRDNTSKNQ
ncbi:MAG: TerC family protein [Syntrophaceae bacterium]|nr:TerC family protein [Syntrophaceae bacterium]